MATNMGWGIDLNTLTKRLGRVKKYVYSTNQITYAQTLLTQVVAEATTLLATLNGVTSSNQLPADPTLPIHDTPVPPSNP